MGGAAPGLCSSGPVVYRCHVSQSRCQNMELNHVSANSRALSRDGRTPRARVQDSTVKADLTGVTPLGSVLPASLISKGSGGLTFCFQGPARPESQVSLATGKGNAITCTVRCLSAREWHEQGCRPRGSSCCGDQTP